MGDQGTKWRRNMPENFNRLSRAHERYRQTTDGRAIAFAKSVTGAAAAGTSVDDGANDGPLVVSSATNVAAAVVATAAVECIPQPHIIC